MYNACIRIPIYDFELIKGPSEPELKVVREVIGMENISVILTFILKREDKIHEIKFTPDRVANGVSKMSPALIAEGAVDTAGFIFISNRWQPAGLQIKRKKVSLLLNELCDLFD